MIPKKIHYCWFGGNPLPEDVKRYIESWKKYCPDYDLIRWDESNYDVHKNAYSVNGDEHFDTCVIGSDEVFNCLQKSKFYTL